MLLNIKNYKSSNVMATDRLRDEYFMVAMENEQLSRIFETKIIIMAQSGQDIEDVHNIYVDVTAPWIGIQIAESKDRLVNQFLQYQKDKKNAV